MLPLLKGDNDSTFKLLNLDESLVISPNKTASLICYTCPLKVSAWLELGHKMYEIERDNSNKKSFPVNSQIFLDEQLNRAVCKFTGNISFKFFNPHSESIETVESQEFTFRFDWPSWRDKGCPWPTSPK